MNLLPSSKFQKQNDQNHPDEAKVLSLLTEIQSIHFASSNMYSHQFPNLV